MYRVGTHGERGQAPLSLNHHSPWNFKGVLVQVTVVGFSAWMLPAESMHILGLEHSWIGESPVPTWVVTTAVFLLARWCQAPYFATHFVVSFCDVFSSACGDRGRVAIVPR